MKFENDASTKSLKSAYEVLLAGGLPSSLAAIPDAVFSAAESVTAIVSGLNTDGVQRIRDLLTTDTTVQVRLAVLVHATCETNEAVLSDLWTLSETSQVRAWVLPSDTWGQRCSWVLIGRRDSPHYVVWTSSAGNFGLAEQAIDENHLLVEADTVLVDRFLSRFSELATVAAPLTSETLQIPALIPARGTEEGQLLWEEYLNTCLRAAQSATEPSETQAKTENSPSGPLGATALKQEIQNSLGIPAIDGMLPCVMQLFEKGDLITIDKGSRIPPLEVPIKAEWFGIDSFREVGVVSRELKYKISVLDEKTGKKLEARRRALSSLREKFSFPLADGSRWMPSLAKPLFFAELNRYEEEGTELLKSIVSGDPDNWVRSKRDLVTRDANRLYQEFHPGKEMPPKAIDEIMEALSARFKKATASNFLPNVSFMRTSLRQDPEQDHVSPWSTAKTLLKGIAEYPRTALTSRAFFFRGLKLQEGDLLQAMNVADDYIVKHWFEPNSLADAQAELEVLAAIEMAELSDREKCETMIALLQRQRSLTDIKDAISARGAEPAPA